MECQSSDSKKIFKVFDASKRKRTRKKRDGLDDSNSLATDDSASGYQPTVLHASSPKASLQDVPTAQTVAIASEAADKRERESSPSVCHSPERDRKGRSPRRHRRSMREGVSLALKAGLVSTPRSTSPHQDMEGVIDSIPQDQDSFIYTFLEEAIKRDKKRQRHSRRHFERRTSRDRDASLTREHRHHHRRKREDRGSRDRDRDRDRERDRDRDRDREREREREHEKERSKREVPVTSPAIDQTVLFETFAKLCAQLNEKTTAFYSNAQVPRTLSHKSLQCEVIKRDESFEVDQQPVRLRGREQSRETVSKTRSHENFRERIYSHDKLPPNPRDKVDRCVCCFDKDVNKYSSKMNMSRSRTRNVDDRYPDYPPEPMPLRNNLDQSYRSRPPDLRDYRDYDREYARDRNYDCDKRRYCEQKTSRSFDVHREIYPPEEDKYSRRTARSENVKEKHYDERDKYYDEKHLESRDRYIPSKDRRVRRLDRCDRNSIASRDDECRDRDRFSERERDSGLSVADGENSTVSGKSNYLRVVKQEISEQREAMDKMMKLWKELMRCFKGLSTQGQQAQNKTVHDSAANVQESAAAQLRLWRECMRRYETVARDVGDTDARLMEEINKQRSEMAEMANMWQECLQRYREMSSDFNNLKEQVNSNKPPPFVPPEIPTRLPAAPLTCAEGEGSVPPAPYRLPPHYPQMPPPPLAAGYPGGGSPLRSRASAPPAWWWTGEGPRDSPRRRSSPESRGSRDRRHRHKDRDDSRYKEKSSKPSAARSEHRHRKR